jgi:hypothetical protein
LTINGTLTVTGNTYQVTVINISTNVYAGTSTNYVNETIYSTNISYTTYLVVTNQTITNTVDTYVNIGGNFTVGNGASFWGTNASIYLPTLTITGTLAQATGTWDWAGATWLNPPTNNWVFGTPGAVTNSASEVSGLTLTTSGGIVTLGGSIPPSGDALTTNQVNGLIASGITVKADSNKTVSVVINGVTNTVIIGTGGVIDLGNIAVVTGSVAHATTADYATSSGIASNVHSGSATTGQVATANGSGGTFWATPAAGGGGGGQTTAVWSAAVGGWTADIVGSIVSSTAVAVAEYNLRSAGGTEHGIMSTSAQTNNLHSIYATRSIGLPASALSWASTTALVFYVQNSSASALTNQVLLRFTSPSFAQFTTNLVPVAAKTVIVISTNNLGAFSTANATNDWKMEVDFQNRNSSSNIIFEPVMWNVNVLK